MKQVAIGVFAILLCIFIESIITPTPPKVCSDYLLLGRTFEHCLTARTFNQ